MVCQMQIHIPDPDFTTSERSRANFWLAAKIALGFVAVLWAVEFLNVVLGLELQRFGVRPREPAGLPGILLAPLLHGGLPHLISNSVPLLVVGTGMLYLYPNSALKMLPAVYLGPGVAVWLFGSASSVHIGASGLVYGLVAYVFTGGLIRRDRRAIAASMLVYFLYGTLVWGVFPIKPGVSWETHLAAALIGLAMALAFRHYDIPPRKRYDWKDESSSEEPARDSSDESRGPPP
jgi:membrane associated rhomboid family serine protease